MAIFQITKDYQVIISPEYLKIPAFENIFKADKDKNKKQAYKIFTFVHFYTHHKSPYSKYGLEERKTILAKDLELGSNFKITGDIEHAIEVYKNLNETLSAGTLASARGALITSRHVFDRLTVRIKQLLEGTDEDLPDLDEAVSKLQNLLTLSEKLPKVISVIENLEEKIKKEESQGAIIRGGGEAGEFED